jgi:hypothetical protein
MATPSGFPVTEEQWKKFDTDGYVVLDRYQVSCSQPLHAAIDGRWTDHLEHVSYKSWLHELNPNLCLDRAPTFLIT